MRRILTAITVSQREMLSSLGTIIVLEDDYHGGRGDTFVLYQRGGAYGFLVFGWGSCEACDALRGCETVDEVRSLQDRLAQSIRWKQNAENMKAYLSEGGVHELSHYGHSEGFRRFVQRVGEMLH
jgi:hypothetical protein